MFNSLCCAYTAVVFSSNELLCSNAPSMHALKYSTNVAKDERSLVSNLRFV